VKNIFTARRWLLLFPAVALLMLLYVLWPIQSGQTNGSSMRRGQTPSLRVLDRNGTLLREVLSTASATSQPVRLADVPKQVIMATLAAEDKNFYSHFGLDVSAMLRATLQNVRAFRIVSGASTLTQQTARLQLGLERGFFSKLYAMLYAVRLEVHFTKDDILTDYLNRVPYGNQTYGIRAASERYFSKPPAGLTLAEAAFLAGLPQAPTSYDPLRYFAKAKLRQTEVLRRMLADGFITPQQHSDALAQRLDLSKSKRQFLAPHFVDFILKEQERKSESFSEPHGQPLAVLRTTLDMPLQERCEMAVGQQLKKLKSHNVTNGAVVVLDNHTGDVLTMVGSADYFNADISGAYNGATAERQAGSAMKPFTYAIALEQGFTPASILADLPLPFQANAEADGKNMFVPQNYDKKFHGPVRLRQALACSYNIPAVKVLESVGVENLLNRLHRLGLSTLDRDAAFYGLGLTLGNAEVSLLQMTRAYSVFARGGKFLSERFALSCVSASGDTTVYKASQPTAQIYSREVCYLISDILSDNAARRPAFGENSALRFGFAAACKTGTTKDFRDNWAFAVTDDFTIGVWVGNFDGTPMQNVSGVEGAGPVLRDVVTALAERYPNAVGFSKSTFDKPFGVRIVKVCPVSGGLATDNCPAVIEEKFLAAALPKEPCNIHRRFVIDKRNGLIATSNTPKIFQETKVFECFPPAFVNWATEQHRDVPPQNFSMAEDSLAERHETATFEITYPKPQMVFARDPNLRKEFQAIAFTAIAPPASDSVAWFVDDVPIGSSPAASPRLVWQLQSGKHRVQAASGKVRSREVEFFVAD
jgi:penicillin-binding protein 1C